MATTPQEGTTVGSTMDPLFRTSLDIYERNFPATVTQGLTGIIAVITNIAVGIVILLTGLRKKRYFIISLHLAIADFLVGFAYVFVDARRVSVYLSTKGVVVSVVNCLIDVFPMTLAITSSQVFATLVSLDRLIAIGLPIRYGRLGIWYTVGIIGGGWFYSLMDAALVYFTLPDPNKRVAICTNLATYSSGYSLWSTVSRAMWTAFSVLFCLLALYLLRRRFGGDNKRSSGSGDQELKESTKTIAIIVMVMVLTQISSRIGYIITQPLPGVVKSRTGMYLRILQISNSAVNFFIYIWRSPAFRNAMLRRNTRVQPTTRTE